mmetsp:Transcript_85567/g.250517  ORF Transcript_85567/g.250517 Transcript_85567/m.250517 type:complete len:332 (+) Transcript_85567:408-1403(+)
MWNSCTPNSLSTSMCMDTSPDPERHPVVTFGTGSCRVDLCIRLRPGNVTILHADGEKSNWQDRKCGTAEMVSLAAPLIYKDGWPMKTKQEAILTLRLDDEGACGVNLAYVLTCSGSVPPLPDATFWGRPDTFYPNYTKVALELQELSRTPPEVRKCLWAGNPDVHPKRGKFVKAAKNLTDVLDLHLVHGPWGMTRSKRKAGMTLTQQMKWACMVDVQGGGYSGRVPLLLWSGRPLLVVRRGKHADLDQTFYFVGDVPEKPQPWVHYVPVSEDFHDLAANAKWILQPENAERLRRNAMAYAAKYLTLDYAVQYTAKEILKVMKKQDVEKKPR